VITHQTGDERIVTAARESTACLNGIIQSVMDAIITVVSAETS
jgi:hypothetical protein